MNMDTEAYFESIPNTLEHQMRINPSLKIVPNKCTIYSHLSNICYKLPHLYYGIN